MTELALFSIFVNLFNGNPAAVLTPASAIYCNMLIKAYQEIQFYIDMQLITCSDNCAYSSSNTIPKANKWSLKKIKS